MKKTYFFYMFVGILCWGWAKYEVHSAYFSWKGTTYRKGDQFQHFILQTAGGSRGI